MSDEATVLIWAHGQNIERYENLLKTSLTASERQFIEARLAEEGAAMRRIKVVLPGGNKPDRARGSQVLHVDMDDYRIDLTRPKCLGNVESSSIGADAPSDLGSGG